ncbi:intraflagellar transport protein 80 homolog isoform X2 [Amphibalanus amphitrite]|uniref:intraflagellar transport protein 80 homolog isoform X2 n=1 Tax=Amphibalanus amphitrite TaxID=1232801 RepID=UPI001C90F181|nr:intraflagellar transport protein 80 homolog isoform X2 [Amphibalanus amphitrite]
MRFKTSMLAEPRHHDTVTAVGWCNTDEIFSISDDHTILRWNLMSQEQEKVVDLGPDVFPVDLHWVPRDLSSAPAAQKKGGTMGGEIFVVAAADGKFYMMNKVGRVEKTVEAHKGAVLSARWSSDGSALLTAGEDGALKMWSRSGMLRSTLVQGNSSIYSADWGPTSAEVVYSQRKNIIVKPLQPNSKPNSWKGHDGPILTLAWNSNNRFIASGAEDCRYRIWDRYGRMLYNSTAHDYPVTAISWSPSGDKFAVGSFNTLRLCDKKGWSHSLEKPNTGSILRIAWSNDGTQVAGACSNGHVIFAHVIEKRMEWNHFEATLTGRKTICVRDVMSDVWEKLEFQDRIIMTSFAYGFLIVATTGQCFIYSSRNWNTPLIFELKEGNVHLILQSSQVFALVDGNGVYIYTYEARLQSSPRWSGMRLDSVSEQTMSLANDTLACRDSDNEKVIQLMDATTGKAVTDKPFTHKCDVLELALDQHLPASQRKLAFVDANKDLFLLTTRRVGGSRKVLRLGMMVHSLCWSAQANMLAGLQESRLSVWYYPAVIFVDKELLTKTILQKESPDFGKNPSISAFGGSQVSLRRSDGCQVATSISPYPAVLHNYVAQEKWDDAVRLCRFIKSDSLWGCLAGMATVARELETAEIAYSCIDQADKVEYLRYIKDLSSAEAQAAELTLLAGSPLDAEAILIHTNQVFRAIMLNIQLYQWDKALAMAVKYKTHIDTVIAFRKKYLERFEKEETNQLFLQYKSMVKESKRKKRERESDENEEIQDMTEQ